MPRIIYMVGLPCTGKSSYVMKHFNDDNYVIISNDAIVEEEAKKQGKTYNEIWGKLNFDTDIVQACQHKFNMAINDKKDIVIDNTNLTIRSRKKYDHASYEKHAIVMETPEIIRQEWEKQRAIIGKLIPEHVVQSMALRMVVPSIEEGFKTITIIDNNNLLN